MAKQNSKAVSFRFREETCWALAEMAEREGLSQTAVVERLILGAFGDGDVVNRTTGEIVREGVPYSDPRAIPGVVVGVGVGNLPKKETSDFEAKSAEVFGFPCICKHSGCRGAKFVGTGRFQTLCPGCREKGHLGDPRDCGECFNDTGPA